MIVNFLDVMILGDLRQMEIGDVQYCYDTKADDYSKSHARWLRYAGGEAQCAFEGAVTALLKPGARVLDVACGTGTVARRLIAETTGKIDLVLLDASKQMLAKCLDIPAEKIICCMTNMPFTNKNFDLVTCAWGIEILQDPRPALHELVRVTRPGGHICLVFCADRPPRSIADLVLRSHISWSGRGRFLNHNLIGEIALTAGARHVQTLHCSGPAAAVIIHV